MPQHSLSDAKHRLQDAAAILESRNRRGLAVRSTCSLHDRLVVAREFVLDAIEKVEHAEEAISGDKP